MRTLRPSVDASIIATMFGSTARPLSIELFSQWQVAGTSIVAPCAPTVWGRNGLWQMLEKHQAISAWLWKPRSWPVDPSKFMGSRFITPQLSHLRDDSPCDV